MAVLSLGRGVGGKNRGGDRVPPVTGHRIGRRERTSTGLNSCLIICLHLVGIDALTLAKSTGTAAGIKTLGEFRWD